MSAFGDRPAAFRNLLAGEASSFVFNDPLLLFLSPHRFGIPVSRKFSAVHPNCGRRIIDASMGAVLWQYRPAQH